MSESYNAVVKLLSSLGKKIESKSKPKKKLSKPPSNWSNFGIKRYLKENPEVIGNSLFENPLLDNFFDAVTYACETKKARWEEFDKKYVLPITRDTYRWGYDSLRSYFRIAYNENLRSESIDKAIGKKLTKFNRLVDRCEKSRRWFRVVFTPESVQRTLLEMSKTSGYLSAVKDKDKLDALRNVFIKAWQLINKKLESFNITKEQFEAAAAASYSEREQHKQVKQYNELLSRSFTFLRDIDEIFTEYDSRVVENVEKYLTATVKTLASDLDGTTYTDLATSSLLEHVKQTYKNSVPQKVIDIYEKEPSLWLDYARLSNELEHTISDTMLERMALYVAELIRVQVDVTDWNFRRRVLEKARKFFNYIAKRNKRYDVIESVFLQREAVYAAREYVDAFSEQNVTE